MRGLSPENTALLARCVGAVVEGETPPMGPAILNHLLDTARGEGLDAALAETVYQRICRRARQVYAEGGCPGRVELTDLQRDQLDAESARYAGLSSNRVMRVNTGYGGLDVVTADTPALCWRRPGRSYGTDTWERMPL